MCSVRQGLPLKTQGWDAAGFRQGSLSRKQRTAKKHIYKAGWENCSGFHLIPFRAFLNYCLLFTKKSAVVVLLSIYTHRCLDLSLSGPNLSSTRANPRGQGEVIVPGCHLGLQSFLHNAAHTSPIFIHCRMISAAERWN